MSIGILDQDALINPRRFRTNLEVMKLSTYYKSKKDIVRLILDATTTDMYSKVFLRKDTTFKGYPDTLLGKPNIEFGGLVFTNSIYVPLAEDIENCIPDVTIYDKLLPRLKKSPAMSSDLSGNHIRLSTDNLTCNLPYEKSILNRNAVIIHDNNLTSLQNHYEIMEEISKTHLISTRYPIEVKSDEIEKYFQELRISKNYSSYLITDPVSNRRFKEIANISQFIGFKDSSNLFNNNLSVKAKVKETMRRILYLKSEEKFNKIVVDYNTSLDPEYQKVFHLLNSWADSRSWRSFESFLCVNRIKELRPFIMSDPVLVGLATTDPKLIKLRGGIILI